MEEIIRIKPIEIVHLNLRYSHVRVQDPRAVIRMADSIERYGQIMPILVVTADAPRYTLIDGYLRVAAAKRCGKDTLVSHIWHGSEKDALCHVLIKDNERQWDIFGTGRTDTRASPAPWVVPAPNCPFIGQRPELGVAAAIDIGLTARQSSQVGAARQYIKLGSHTGIDTDGARQHRACRATGRKPDKTPAFHPAAFYLFQALSTIQPQGARKHDQ